MPKASPVIALTGGIPARRLTGTVVHPMAEREGAPVSKSGAPDPLIGRTINERFKIRALIARGGMGKVYRAEQAPLGRLCAVKVLNPNYSGEQEPEFQKRFFLEASIASKLTHPNTVTIFDYGRTEDDIYFMAMEYLEGKTLHRAIREARTFPEERIVHIARQICRALREAHALGVIHRDLKPANIFLVTHGDENDFVKVLDFGLVKDVSENQTGEDLTQTGLFMGSPKYMAPEQIQGEHVDARTDIYSLGIILYEMLCGRVPFDKANGVNILMAHVNDAPPPMREFNPQLQISPLMEEIVTRCMAKDPDERFTSMDEVLSQLKLLGGGYAGTITGMADSTMPPPVSVRPSLQQAAASSRPSEPSGPSGPLVSVGMPQSSPWPSSNVPSANAPSANALSNYISGYQPDKPASVSPPGTAAPPGLVPYNSEPPNLRSGKGGVIAALVGVLVVVVGTVLFFTRQQPMQGSSPTPGVPSVPSIATVAKEVTPPPAPPPATSVVTPPPVAAPVLVKVRVSSEPEGATVKEDGVEICTGTPCDVVYRGPDADASKAHKLTFAKSGYKAETKTIKVGDSPVSVKLPKGGAAWVAPPKNDPPKVPEGFKDYPY